MLDYLESQAPAGGFRFGSGLSIADVAVATFFRNAAFARFRIDAARWPRTAAWIERVLATPSFAKLAAHEEAIARAPIARHRDVLRSLGAPVSAETCGLAEPRRGIMPI